jgi:hypothetical protein
VRLSTRSLNAKISRSVRVRFKGNGVWRRRRQTRAVAAHVWRKDKGLLPPIETHNRDAWVRQRLRVVSG